MKVKVLSKDVFSVSVPTGTNIATDYVITLNCSEKGARDFGCKVKTVTGSMITAEADRINIDLIDKSNVKDIKLDMCDDKFKKPYGTRFLNFYRVKRLTQVSRNS